MARTYSVSDSVVIDADPSAIYAKVSNPALMGRWSPENRGATVPDGAQEAYVGMVFDGHNKRGPMGWTTRCTVTAADPGERFAFRVRAIGRRKPVLPGRIATWEYRFEAGRRRNAGHGDLDGRPARLAGCPGQRVRQDGDPRAARSPTSSARNIRTHSEQPQEGDGGDASPSRGRSGVGSVGGESGRGVRQRVQHRPDQRVRLRAPRVRRRRPGGSRPGPPPAVRPRPSAPCRAAPSAAPAPPPRPPRPGRPRRGSRRRSARGGAGSPRARRPAATTSWQGLPG